LLDLRVYAEAALNVNLCSEDAYSFMRNVFIRPLFGHLDRRNRY